MNSNVKYDCKYNIKYGWRLHRGRWIRGNTSTVAEEAGADSSPPMKHTLTRYSPPPRRSVNQQLLRFWNSEETDAELEICLNRRTEERSDLEAVEHFDESEKNTDKSEEESDESEKNTDESEDEDTNCIVVKKPLNYYDATDREKMQQMYNDMVKTNVENNKLLDIYLDEKKKIGRFWKIWQWYRKL